jgi:hypothetical protein
MTTGTWNSNIYQQIYGFIYVLKSWQKKQAMQKEEVRLFSSALEKLKEVLKSSKNDTLNLKEISKSLRNNTLKEILKNNSQIEILANGIFDKNNLLFTYNKPLEFSLPDDELSFAKEFDKLVPENVKKINIKFNVVEINVVEKFKKISNIPVEFEVFIREGNQDKKLNNRDKEYEFDYR